MGVNYQRVNAGAGVNVRDELLSSSQNFFAFPSAVAGHSTFEKGVIQLVTRKPRACRLRIMPDAFGNFLMSKSNWP